MKLLPLLCKGPNLLHTILYSFLWRQFFKSAGLRLDPSSQILGEMNIQIGSNFRAGRMLWLEAVTRYQTQCFNPRVVIGDRVSCSDSVHIACINSVKIGDDVLIGSKVHITDHNHGCYSNEVIQSSPMEPPALRKLTGTTVKIGDRVFLGDAVIVMPGSVIGNGTLVGANSLVTGELPPDTICVGIPARPIKRYDYKSSSWVCCRT
jgi:acetyltransferase-like isoleucine patch superfamily enzyme